MPNYRRIILPNSTYFFTVTTHERKPLLTSSFSINCLRQAFKTTRTKHPFILDAFVILPNHIHTIWTLPEGDSDHSLRWNLIKNRFTRLYMKEHNDTENLSNSRRMKRERGVWQRRFWEHLVRDDRDFNAHLDYIHFNPVKHGYVNAPASWKWSSFRRYVKLGWYHHDWGMDKINEPLINDTGE